MRTVFFAKSYPAAIRIADNLNIVFYAVDTGGWNNFSQNFSAGLLAKSENDVSVEERVFLMFKGGGYTSASIRKRLLEKGADTATSQDMNFAFVSMLPDSHVYKRVVEKVGLSQTLELLRSCHDATIVMREEGFEEERALVETQEFWYGALRSNEAYNAFRRSYQYLLPRDGDYVPDSAVSFQFSAPLYPADNEFEVLFDFSPDPLKRNRIAVVIGENGSGKTQLLLALVAQMAEGSSTPSSVASCNKVIVFSSIASDAYPRTLPIDSRIDYQYFSLVSVTNDGADPTTAAIIDCLRDDQRIFFTFGEGQFASRYSLMIHLLSTAGLQANIYVPLEEGGEQVSFDEKKWGSVRYHPLSKGLNEQRQLQLYKQINYRGRPIFWGGGAEPRQLSSGENAIFRFAAQIVGNIEVGSLLIFDEPETHLHPRYISFMMDTLASILESTLSVAIIATHSAYIVREVPRQRVSILSLSDRQIDVVRPRLQTFGASVDSISRFVFGDPALGHHYQATLRAWADELPKDLGIDQIVEKYGSDMNQETLSYVAQYISEEKH